jgi:hypothetical protein
MPNLAVGLAQAAEDRKMWELARAKGVPFLMAQLSGLGRVYLLEIGTNVGGVVKGASMSFFLLNINDTQFYVFNKKN